MILMADSNDPNVVIFLLIVGAVSVCFAAAFVLRLPGDVAIFMTYGVTTVMLVSITVGMALNALGYFGEQPVGPETTDTTVEEPQEQDSPVRFEKEPNKPLPPLINFDQELNRLYELYENDPPEQLRSFREDYERMKSVKANRDNVISDLRASINPLSVIVDGDEEMREIVDGIGDRLLQYINGTASEFLSVEQATFYLDGEEKSIPEVQREEARIRTTVHNRGDRAKAEVAVRFLNQDGVKVKTTYLPVGEIAEGGEKKLDTRVYVPSVSTDVELYATAADESEEVLDL